MYHFKTQKLLALWLSKQLDQKFTSFAIKVPVPVRTDIKSKGRVYPYHGNQIKK